MMDLHRRIAERAYFAAMAGVGNDDLDRWLTAEARETSFDVAAAPAPKPKRKARTDAVRR